MKLPVYPFWPLAWRSCCSHGVRGHIHPWIEIKAPHIAVGICKNSIHLHFNASIAPRPTKAMNPRCITASVSAAI